MSSFWDWIITLFGTPKFKLVCYIHFSVDLLTWLLFFCRLGIYLLSVFFPRERHLPFRLDPWQPPPTVRQRYNGFHILTGKMAITLYADSPEEKTYWMGLLQEVWSWGPPRPAFRPVDGKCGGYDGGCGRMLGLG